MVSAGTQAQLSRQIDSNLGKAENSFRYGNVVIPGMYIEAARELAQSAGLTFTKRQETQAADIMARATTKNIAALLKCASEAASNDKLSPEEKLHEVGLNFYNAAELARANGRALTEREEAQIAAIKEGLSIK